MRKPKPETPDWLEAAITPEAIERLRAEERRLLDGEKEGMDFFAAMQRKIEKAGKKRARREKRI